MQQDQSVDVSFWITKPFSKFNDRTDLSKRIKMFTSKTQTSNSTFYTELETDVANKESGINELTEQQDEACIDIPSNCSDTIAGDKKQGNYNGHSFSKIASFGGFSRFRPFVMSAENSTERVDIEENEENSLEVSFVRVSHGVLEYRSSR